jgi:LmbE family N-acetylglucosaminyl deacetylase
MKNPLLLLRALFYKRLFWKNVHNYFYIIEKHFKVKPRVVEYIKGNKVLVISPHIDDDVIGCGGLLYKYYLLNIPVYVIYVTDGDKIRREEGEKISNYLHYNQTLFLGCTVNHVGKHSELVDKFTNIIESVQPDIVLIPFLIDRHTDHVNTNKFFVEACRKSSHKLFIICGYEVWTPIIPNRIVDISAVIENKKHAIEICKSQFYGTDYTVLATSLNRYRGESHNIEYGEAYYCVPVNGYINLWEKIYG